MPPNRRFQEVSTRVIYLSRNENGDFIDSNGVNRTDEYYNGTHQIIVSESCIESVLSAIEKSGIGVEEAVSIMGEVTLNFSPTDFVYIYQSNGLCYIVAPMFSEQEFFDKLVSVVEPAIADISTDLSCYTIRRKIPSTPKPSPVREEMIDGILCCHTKIYFGRGYGYRFSQVDIRIPRVPGYVSYLVQRFKNDVINGPIEDGGRWVFNGPDIEKEAVCFAYGIDSDEYDSKEGAKRSHRFLHKMTQELIKICYPEKQTSTGRMKRSYLSDWRKAQEAETARFMSEINEVPVDPDAPPVVSSF